MIAIFELRHIQTTDFGWLTWIKSNNESWEKTLGPSIYCITIFFSKFWPLLPLFTYHLLYLWIVNFSLTSLVYKISYLYGCLKDIDVYWKDREKRHLWIVPCFLFDQRSRIVKLFIILRDKQWNRRNHPQWVEVIPKEHSHYFSSTFNSTRYSENEIHSSKNGRNFQVKSEIRKKL